MAKWTDYTVSLPKQVYTRLREILTACYRRTTSDTYSSVWRLIFTAQRWRNARGIRYGDVLSVCLSFTLEYTVSKRHRTYSSC